MTCRSILVLLDPCPVASTVIGSAISLAKTLDCHLRGLALTDHIGAPPAPKPSDSDKERSARVSDSFRDQAERIVEQFRSACRIAGLRSFDAVIDEGHKVDALLRHSRGCDLTVLAQGERFGQDRLETLAMLEAVVLQSARPTLLLPASGVFAGEARNVMVAWNDSREALRAVSDALPLLQKATDVEIVHWNVGPSMTDMALHARLDALRQWLVWHGVPTRTAIEVAGSNLASVMNSKAALSRADLIVMGAYGRPRGAERVLGGATRDMLESMSVPVLLSH